MTGVARSEQTLGGVPRPGRCAVKADVTDQASVRDVLEQAAAAHGGVDLVVNAASAYGGDRSGPFGGGPIAEAPPEAFDSWAVAPARSAFSFLSASGRVPARSGDARNGDPGHGRLVPSRRCRPWPLGSRRVRRQGDHPGRRPRASRARDPRRPPDHRCPDPAVHPPARARSGGRARTISPPRCCSSPTRAHVRRHTELQVTPLAERWVP